MPRYSVLLEATGSELPMLDKRQAENYVIFLQQTNPAGHHGEVIESQLPELEFANRLVQTISAMLGKEHHDHEKHLVDLRRANLLLDRATELLGVITSKGKATLKWRERVREFLTIRNAYRKTADAPSLPVAPAPEDAPQ
ncbi:hypothetical protein [Pseudomonas sp.]|jgi:hypothetical protein|uniref:hypothetical protein n=1 Tax=Pseudomonas sp. TaxID=306 RepID=UPI002ED875CD